ncbi:helix-turn-helix domain-containing protein [Janibacter sp. FSL W8-0316]|uniref:helix-turn-helix domain-containing protein n=1 Tax=Janibacter sp. FSL W8-0316 TaxID=2975325 RepID=UPI0030F6972A
MKRLLHPIPDAAQALGVSRTTIYELISAGALKPVKIGRRTFIAQDELERYVRSLTEVSA